MYISIFLPHRIRTFLGPFLRYLGHPNVKFLIRSFVKEYVRTDEVGDKH